MKKQSVIVMILLAVVILLTACGKKDSPSENSQTGKEAAETASVSETASAAAGGSESAGLEGVWKFTDIQCGTEEDRETWKDTYERIKAGKMNHFWTFTGRKLTQNLDGLELRWNYRVEENKMVIVEEGGTYTETYDFKLNGDTLEFPVGNSALVYTRQK